MDATSEKKPKKQICAGILAHVDAGKTTLSEGLLYTSGSIRKMGRVDKQDAFLDNYELERARGITIFSKQAVFQWKELEVTLLDTPGHVDFSAEMERTLQVLDYAVLLISAADGVQGHTQTLWRLLKRYQIPVFLFVNKMDQVAGADAGAQSEAYQLHKAALLAEIQERLDENCVDFSCIGQEPFFDALAMCAEPAMEQYLEQGRVEDACIRQMVGKREVFPCFFGSALRLHGVEEFLDGFARFAQAPAYPQEFAAKAFKIARDEQGNRLTYLKITGGCLKARAVLSGRSFAAGQESRWEEKVNQIRIYSGARFEAVPQAQAGMVCAVTGLTQTMPGQGFGTEPDTALPVLEPVLAYRVILPDGCDAAVMLPKLRQLEEEEPQLHIVWDEHLREIQVQLMGEVQLEILENIIKERFGVLVQFGAGNIVYKETIASQAEGVGHFEPLRHYAEVHLLLEPQDQGSGMQFASSCSEDLLDRNWQRLVLTHLKEREHKGVLTGSALTDMKVTLAAGRAHLKHTEGGDFRQATYRALRQGLMQAQSVLLEPYYEFRLELPEGMVGRAMTDIENMHGSLQPPTMENGTAVLSGSAPVVTMRGYQKEVTEYTRGLGRLQCTLGGYAPCHNTQEVLEQRQYDPQSDLENPSSSVFCAHGAGFVVEWYEVKDYMHLESVLTIQKPEEVRLLEEAEKLKKHAPSVRSESIGTDEVDRIIAGTYQANQGKKAKKAKYTAQPKKRVYGTQDSKAQDLKHPAQKAANRREYFLVDGYNIIFAWEELSEIAKDNIDGARGRLLDIMCNYQAVKKFEVIVVFDAYRVEGHQTEYYNYHNIHVVYTKEAETADQYIERFAHENGRKYNVTVATSDGMEQIIIRGQGCRLISARELEAEVRLENKRMHTEYLAKQPQGGNMPFEQAILKSLNDV
ncbi:MAG: TetM/TetW/TetO/TetS family tetracycline resistance ribosomal protection protein [Eubacterium sp.]|nr:TetM/TetW/TetO/TetS family tetracycline resistance ribosomal protection protein [Eubacterium sp.]